MVRNKIWLHLFYFILILPLFIFVFYGMQVKKNSTNEFMFISFAIGKQDIQRVNVWKGEDNIYYVFLPTETEKIELELATKQSLVLSENTYKNGDDIQALCGTVYEAQILGRRNDVLETGRMVFMQADNVPTVYIEANCTNTNTIVQEKDEKTDIFIATFERDGELDFTGNCTVKGRGNSSWMNIKKPYNLLFAQEETLLGMNGQKKWALIPNGADPSLLKNKIANMFSAKWGLEYTPEMEYVNLYVNGTYQGMYLLAQRIAAKGGCISWDENKQNILFERDIRYKEENFWFETNYCGMVYESTQALSREEFSSCVDIFLNLESILFDSDNDAVLEVCGEMIDIDSWIKQYMIEEFIANVDMDYASRYYYLESDSNVICAGPMWDYDYSMGAFSLTSGEFPPCIVKYEDVKSGYFKQLMQYEDFKAEFVKYYQTEFKPIIEEVVFTDLPDCISDIENSMSMNDIRWNSGVTFEEEAVKVTDWLEKRAAFWKSYWEEGEDFCRVVFNDGCGVYYMKKGEALSFWPQSYLHTKTRWFDKSGKEVFEGMIVTKDVQLYPEYLE